jgi:methyl-accepting chemotaxis protein
MPSAITKTALDKRLNLLGITAETFADIARIYPAVDQNIESIVDAFHVHMVNLPEPNPVFEDRDRAGILKRLQCDHWRRLFSANIDDTYMDRAIRVGRAHHDHDVTPVVYIAGYNFVQRALTTVIADAFRDDPALPRLINSAMSLITLDMDLSISVYMREYWLSHTPRLIDV